MPNLRVDTDGPDDLDGVSVLEYFEGHESIGLNCRTCGASVGRGLRWAQLHHDWHKGNR